MEMEEVKMRLVIYFKSLFEWRSMFEAHFDMRGELWDWNWIAWMLGWGFGVRIGISLLGIGVELSTFWRRWLEERVKGALCHDVCADVKKIPKVARRDVKSL